MLVTQVMIGKNWLHYKLKGRTWVPLEAVLVIFGCGILRQDPLEAILVIFGCRALICFV